MVWDIVNNWKETTLGEVAEFSNGRTSPERFDSGKCEVFGSNGVIGLSDETNSDANTIIIGRVGSYCGSLYFSKNKCWVTDNAIKAKAKETSDPFYLYYLLTTQKLNSKAAGSGQPLINQEILNSIDVTIPPLPEQKAIAAILSSFDDKIELLRRQNKTLESIAQTIFKEWFVKFKIKNQKLKIKNETGLPEGWRMGRIYEFLEVDYGYPFKSELFNEIGNGLPLIRIRDLRDGIPAVYTNEQCPDSYIVNPGDIIAGMDAEFRPCIWKGQKGLLNQRVCRFRPKKNIGHVFILETMRPHLNFFEKTKFGTTVSHLGKNDLDSIEAVIPERALVERFSSITEPLFQKIVLNNSQIQTLSKLRDALLPKLMKGEIRVKDTEKITKEAI